MTHQEVILQKKAEALNKIRKIYDPRFDDYDRSIYSYEEEPFTKIEQRDMMVGDIIHFLEEDLKKLKKKC